MRYTTCKEIFCEETGETIKVGDVVTVKFNSGGGAGGCRVTKITDTGFQYNQGGGRDKSTQYKNINEIRK